MLLWIFPAIAHLLFAAHLLFHTSSWALAALPLLAMQLWYIKRNWVLMLEGLVLIAFASEWLRAGWFLVQSRLDAGRPWQTAGLIMVGVAAYTLLSAIVLMQRRLNQRYR